ncbi:MAG: NAD(+) synthase [Candidatus Eremiobacterota bacterium]
MRIACAQINSRIGDLEGNRERLLAAWRCAARQEADLVVAPELIVCGYPPRDLLFDPGFLAGCEESLDRLAAATRGGPPLLVGTPLKDSSGLLNAAVLLHGGRRVLVQGKRRLPADDVFHEPRWFTPGSGTPLVRLPGLPPAGVLVCEDLWQFEGYPGAELLLCLNASPYRQGVLERRLEVARRPAVPVIYCNAVGGQDDLIFDGASFAVDRTGRVAHGLPRFQEAVEVLDWEGGPELDELPLLEEVRRALVLGIRDFFGKNGLRRAVLGLSGGIDSAVAACLTAEALGPERVTALAIPSRFTDPRSTACAAELAENLGLTFRVVPLEPLHRAAEEVLGGCNGETAENIQARLRMTVLMAEVNRNGGALLNTSNKTELSLGYGTLYGDLAGALGPLNDLTKPQVQALAELYGDRIPRFIRERTPSAELRPGQVDPFDYARVSPEVERHVETGSPTGYAGRIAAAEHKRRQGPIGLKISRKAFGSGRWMPVTAHRPPGRPLGIPGDSMVYLAAEHPVAAE